MSGGLPVWRPRHAIEIVAGTPPGGGLDRTARALAAALEAAGVLDVPVTVRNVPGDGARRAWSYLDEHRGDPHVVCVSHPNLITDWLTGVATFDHRAYAQIAMLYTEFIAFAVRADSLILSGVDLLGRLGPDASSLSVALSTAAGNPNHVALARLSRHAGGDPRAPFVRVFDSALDAVADVVSGKSEVAAVTAASTAPALAAGQVRVLAVSAPVRLTGPLADVPTWNELFVDCVLGAWRGIAGAHGIGESHVAFWQHALEAACGTPAWDVALARHGWTSSWLYGPALHRHLERERQEMTEALADLGMLRPLA